MAETIRDYLASIGFKVDESSRQRFEAALAASESRSAQLDKKLAALGAQLGALGKALGETGKALTELADTPARKAEEAADRVHKRNVLLAKTVKDLGITAVTTASVFVRGFTEIARKYQDLYYISQRTGESAQTLSRLQFLGPQVGLGADSLVAATEALATATRNPGLRAFLNSWGIANNDVIGFIGHLRGMPPYLQDAYAQMFGLSTTYVRNVIANWDATQQAQREFNERVKAAGINYDQVTRQSVQATRDLNTVWSQIGMIATQGFTEAYPAIDGALKGIESLLDATLKFNAAHPGAALKENLAAALVSATGLLAIVGKLTGFFSVPGLVRGLYGLAGTTGAAVLGGVTAGAWTFFHPSQAGSADERQFELMNQDQKRQWLLDHGVVPHDGSTPHYQGGGIVPAFVHAGEMVLPTNISQGLQAFFGGQSANSFSQFVDRMVEWLTGNTSYHPIVQVMGFAPGSPSVLAGTTAGGSLGGGGGLVPGGAIDAAGIAAAKQLVLPSTQQDFDAIRDTLTKVGTKLGMNPDQIKMATAGYLSNFYAESKLQHAIQRPGGNDVNWAQWVGSRRRTLEMFGDPHSMSAGERMLYYELTGKYANQFRAAGNAPNPSAAANTAFPYESGGAPQLEQYRAGHVATARRFYDMLSKGTGDTPAATTPGGAHRSLFPPWIKFNSKGQPYNPELDHLSRAERAKIDQSMRWYRAHSGHPEALDLPKIDTGRRSEATGEGARHVAVSQVNHITGSSHDRGRIMADLNRNAGLLARNVAQVIT